MCICIFGGQKLSSVKHVTHPETRCARGERSLHTTALGTSQSRRAALYAHTTHPARYCVYAPWSL